MPAYQAGLSLFESAAPPPPPPPPPADPLDGILNLFVAARAAVGPTQWTWVQANTNDITDAFPPVGLRDPFTSGEGMIQMVSAWGAHVYNPDALAAEVNGTGHSAAGCTEWFRWSLATRQWSLSYYGAEQIGCPAPYYRARDFNGTPPSAHPYDNQCYGRVRQRIYQAYAGTFNSGNRGRVWRPSEPGTQSNGADGQPGVNYTGIFEINMAQAGTGKVLGATGTNAAWGASAGTSLTGANAALLHDWFGTGGPVPFFEGAVQAITVESSMQYTDEVAGKDAFFWTSGSKWLIRTTINSSNPADDTHELVCRDGSVYGGGRGSVQISLDPTRRIVLAVTNDADTNPGAIKFADLKRTWGVSNGWRDATLTGSDIAEFLSINRIDMGCKYDPISGKHLLYNGVGRQVWAITTPTGNPTPDTGWTLEKLPVNASVAAPPTSADTLQTAGGVPGADFIIGINGNWQHHDDVRAQCAILGRQGDVWYLLGPGWTDPRL
ncbi:MAG: hypothetical protein RL227_2479 [Pseudomonadota bacterium]|jgi:hypothetical protein